MYEVGVLSQLVLTEVEWNCHLNARCADNYVFRIFNVVVIKQGTTEIWHSAF